MTDTPDTPDALTVAEAAAALGLSRDGVLKRIHRRQLTAWQVRGKHGREWRVSLGRTPDSNQTVPDTPPVTALDSMDRHDALLAELRALRASVDRLADAMADRQDRTPADATGGTLRPWWRRWLDALLP